MASLGWWFDCIWNELQSRNGGHTCDPDLEAGRQLTFNPDLGSGRHTFKLGHTCWKPTYGQWKIVISDSLFTSLPWPCLRILSLTGAYFFRTPAYTEDQLRHPALWTEHSGTFHLQLATVGLGGLQPVSHPNKFHINR